ncbi:MAG: ERCC4 domain-containing protein [bacterium]
MLNHYSTTSNPQPAAPITIIADLRERASGIPRALSEKGLEVRMQRLEIGDYLLTPKIAVERKTTADFIQSIFDKRLFAQVGALRMSFPCPILLLEKCGSPSREIHPSAVRGAMLYVSLLNRIPIIHTENAADTVEMLFAMAQLVHRETAQEFSLHSKRRSSSPQKTQRYILETIPGIGPHLAKALLQQFGNLQAVFNAAPDDLMEVPGIGRGRAEKIRMLLQRDYRSGQQLISKVFYNKDEQQPNKGQPRMSAN